MPSEALVVAMASYHEALQRAGVLRGGDGLRPSREGFRVRFADGAPTVIDGPFAETKELVAGFTVLEVASREEALDWARRWPAEDGGGAVELEVRPLYEIEDFGDGEALARIARVRERLASA
ncbi:MAG TPA: YciI family protein [Gemmatimonadaceae bacterium]|nr:YciI family protein [Gemmatimonadaceae bacterium]